MQRRLVLDPVLVQPHFAGGSAGAINFFGEAGGLGSGLVLVPSAAGNTKFDMVNGIFTGTGGAIGFDSQGSGIF
jgi:hypothetical protein